jgi:hypothetical protein
VYSCPAPRQGAKSRRRNLRDPILAVIADLSRDRGKTWATERGFVKELQRRTGGEQCTQAGCACHEKGGLLHGGYRAGDGSIRRIILRLRRAGLVGHERVKPGRRMIDGVIRNSGGQHNWIISREDRRKARRQAREEARQARDRRKASEREEKRARELRAIEARAERELAGSGLALASQAYELPANFLAVAPSKDETAEQVAHFEQRRAEQLAAARARADLWTDDEDEPPD